MFFNSNEKTAYICGPLTELSEIEKEKTKKLYEQIADLCQEVTGKRAFVPHEHYDPIKHSNFSSSDVDQAERNQIYNKTSELIVVALAPSWGGGIEVEMANHSNIPAILLCEVEKIKQRRISRLLMGNPAFIKTIIYTGQEHLFRQLKIFLRKFYSIST